MRASSGQAPEIRAARPDEAAQLSGLAVRSKASWGYDEAQMRVFREELTLSPEAIASQPTFVLAGAEGALGFYSLLARDAREVELEHLFVDEPALRRGYGRTLFEHACREAARRGYLRMVIQTDPHAEGFYLAQGARVRERIPSSIPGRSIPFMQLELSPGTGGC